MQPPKLSWTSNGNGSASVSAASGNNKSLPVTPEECAERVLKSLGMWRIPVDPFAILKEEGIELAPGAYGNKFDARIEYVKSDQLFIVYYKTPEHGPTPGRMR